MLSPLPLNKRAKNPRQPESGVTPKADREEVEERQEERPVQAQVQPPQPDSEPQPGSTSNPFARLEVN